nr:Transposon Tf2-12 polyprotein [Ipomoea batatas]
MAGLQSWAQSELRRQNVKDLSSAIATADDLVDFAGAGSQGKDGNKTKGESGEGKSVSAGKSKRVETMAASTTWESRLETGCWNCGGDHLRRNCPKKQTVNTLKDVESKDDETAPQICLVGATRCTVAEFGSVAFKDSACWLEAWALVSAVDDSKGELVQCGVDSAGPLRRMRNADQTIGRDVVRACRCGAVWARLKACGLGADLCDEMGKAVDQVRAVANQYSGAVRFWLDLGAIISAIGRLSDGCCSCELHVRRFKACAEHMRAVPDFAMRQQSAKKMLRAVRKLGGLTSTWPGFGSVKALLVRQGALWPSLAQWRSKTVHVGSRLGRWSRPLMTLKASWCEVGGSRALWLLFGSMRPNLGALLVRKGAMWCRLSRTFAENTERGPTVGRDAVRACRCGAAWARLKACDLGADLCDEMGEAVDQVRAIAD